MSIKCTKILSVVALVIIVLFMLIGIDKHEYDPNSPSGHLKVLISDGNKQTTLISLLDNMYLPLELKENTRYKIHLEQDESIFSETVLCIKSESIIEVEGYDKGTELLIPLASYESVYINSETNAKVKLSIYTYNNKIEKQVFYINDIQYISNIDQTKDTAIVLTDNISNENLLITKPCEIYTNGFEINIDEFIVDYTYDKPFIVHLTDRNQIKVKEFYVNTPNANITIDILFFNEDPNYCIYAKSLNGKDIGKEIDLYDAKKLIKLIDNNYYPVLNKNTILNIYDITLSKEILAEFYEYNKDSIFIYEPVKLNILGSFELNNIKLIVETQNEGEIKFNIHEEGEFNYDSLEINAPLCSLVWVNNPPKEQYIAKYMNVKKYQGNSLSEYSLGGKGKSNIIGFSCNNLDWYIRGNAIETKIPFSVSDSTLDNVPFSFETDNGKAKIDEKYLKEGKLNLNEAPRIVVTDKDGNTREYTVSVLREKLDLPIIYINTENRKTIVSNEDYIRATFSMDAEHINSSYTIESSEIGIRGRGNSTWRLFDKKPYRIKFDTKVSVFGLPANRDWVLLANYSDQSLIRNYVATEMGKSLDNLKFTPSSYPVDVFVNGEYAGVYTIGEQIEVAKSRVDIEEDYENPDTGYLLEVGGTDNVLQLGRDFFHCNLLKWVAIKSPDTLVMSKDHFKYISDYTKAADNAVKNKTNYSQYIDIASLIDWTILHEFTCNLDSGFRRSCFLYKEKGGKLFMGPAWDYDLAFGNYFRDYSYDKWFTGGGEILGRTWTTCLYEDPDFCLLLKERWNEVKEDLKNTAINATTNGSNMVYRSQIYNFNKWDKLLGKKTSLQPEHIKELKTYDQHVEYLLQFIQNRYDWLDKAINNLP